MSYELALEDDDPVLLAFLAYLDEQMTTHPELTVEADDAQLARIAQLVEGVEFEDDEETLCG